MIFFLKSSFIITMVYQMMSTLPSHLTLTWFVTGVFSESQVVPHIQAGYWFHLNRKQYNRLPVSTAMFLISGILGGSESWRSPSVLDPPTLTSLHYICPPNVWYLASFGLLYNPKTSTFSSFIQGPPLSAFQSHFIHGWKVILYTLHCFIPIFHLNNSHAAL